MFDAPLIQMERDASIMPIGDFRLVGALGRPNVETFFRTHGDRVCLLNGLSTRSVNHPACMAVATTGAVDGRDGDWPTLLGYAARDAHRLPHVNFNATVHRGPHASHVANVEGRLVEALDGTLLTNTDLSLSPLLDPSSERLDRYLVDRAAAEVAKARDAGFAQTQEAALRRSIDLVANRGDITFPPTDDLVGRARNGIQLLSKGIARCVSIASIPEQVGWDTHVFNAQQTPLFDALFADLGTILDEIAAATTTSGTSLADETVVVVYSEMGRTPVYNQDRGRDHWPFTSVMLIGPGITGGRTLGGYDDGYLGIGVNPVTGDRDYDAVGIASTMLGATLLMLGDVDPAEHLPGAQPITAILT
jgi:hypothetical protein